MKHLQREQRIIPGRYDDEIFKNDRSQLNEISSKLKNMVTIDYFEQVIREKTNNKDFILTK